MKQQHSDFRELYPSNTEPPEESTGGRHSLFYQPGWGLRFLIKLSIWLVFLALGTAAIRESVFPPQASPGASPVSRAFVPAHSLPFKEQWVIDYRSAASRAGLEQRSRPARSTKWVKNAAYHIIMGEQALSLDHPETAQTHFEEVLKIFPDLQDTRRALGLALLKQGKFDAAADTLEQAVREEASFDVLINLGSACIGAGRFERAEAVLHRARSMRPASEGCLKNLALLYKQTGNLRQAEQHFQAYFRHRPDDLEMIRLYTAMLNKANRAEDAIRFLERLSPLERDPAAIPLLLAKTAAACGDANRAVAALKSAAEHLPPSLTLVEMNDKVFKKIRRMDAFEALSRQLQIKRTLHPRVQAH